MSFPKYETYKESGVEWLGEVPDHWDTSKLKFLTKQIVDGAHFTPTYLDDGIPFLRVTDIQNASLDVDEFKFIPKNEHEELIKRCKPEKGDLLLSKNGTIGIPRIIDWDWEFSIFVSLCLIKFVTTLDSRYAYFFFLSHQIKEQINSQTKQSTVTNLHLDKIENFTFPLPSLDEQTQIARFLDHETTRIDALNAEQERLIELLKEKRQAVISHAVTKGLDPTAPMRDSGVEWLGEVPEHWRVAKVKHVIQSFEQGWSPQCDNVPIENSKEWGILKVGCVNGGTFSPEENKRLPEELDPIPELFLKTGDVLISRANTRELVGSAALVDVDQPNLMLSDKLFRLRTREDMLPRYLVFYLGTSAVRHQIELEATGASSSMLNIGQAVIKELCIPVPSATEQQAITAQLKVSLEKLYRLQEEAQLTQALLQERRSALISAAVTGKIDVRGWKAPASGSPTATLEAAYV